MYYLLTRGLYRAVLLIRGLVFFVSVGFVVATAPHSIVVTQRVLPPLSVHTVLDVHCGGTVGGGASVITPTIFLSAVFHTMILSMIFLYKYFTSSLLSFYLSLSFYLKPPHTSIYAYTI